MKTHFELGPALRAELVARAQEIERCVPYVVLRARLAELLKMKDDSAVVDSDRLLAIYALLGAGELRPALDDPSDPPP